MAAEKTKARSRHDHCEPSGDEELFYPFTSKTFVLNPGSQKEKILFSPLSLVVVEILAWTRR